MRTRNSRDFAAVLDELMAEAELDRSDDTRPAVRLDPLSVADELHNGRIVISSERAAAEYDAGAGDDAPKPEVTAPPMAPEPESLDTNPESIARELGIGNRRPPADLDALRRRFASENHPDRVAAHLRDDAMVRMQIANMLIDEAKRKKKSGGFFFRR